MCPTKPVLSGFDIERLFGGFSIVQPEPPPVNTCIKHVMVYHEPTCIICGKNLEGLKEKWVFYVGEVFPNGSVSYSTHSPSFACCMIGLMPGVQFDATTIRKAHGLAFDKKINAMEAETDKYRRKVEAIQAAAREKKRSSFARRVLEIIAGGAK